MSNISTIHFFGCSLTYGTEISGVNLEHPFIEDVKYTWPVILAHKLNFDDANIKIWARSGATCRDIALTVIDAMHNYDGIFVVGWTWPERRSYWDFAKSTNDNQHELTVYPAFLKNLDKTHPVAKYPELIQHFVKFEGDRNWAIDFLIHLNLVIETAKVLKKQCIHIQIGGNLLELNQLDWFSTQTIPSAQYNHLINPVQNPYAMYTPTLNQHSIFNTWESTDILYKDISLYIYVKELVKSDASYYSGYHWSKKGCNLVADILYDKISKLI